MVSCQLPLQTAEDIVFENNRIFDFQGLVTLTLDRVIQYCIPSCITHRPLPTKQISLKLKILFVDERTESGQYVRTYVRTAI